MLEECVTNSNYECIKCGAKVPFNIFHTFIHDFKCWSLNTAVFNAYVRIFHAEKYGLR